MKNILKYSVLAAAFSAVLFLFAGCQPDGLDTDQFSERDVTLAAIQPNPVMRGGELRIIGSNLQNVSEVKFAGGVSVSSIQTIASGARSEIRVIVPLEGPEVGPVTLVTLSGATLSTHADLTFTEPIVIDSFAPKEVLSGDVITIQGEYLNNVKEVIFGGDVYVTEFIDQSRHSLSVRIPNNAVTGFVIVGDVDEAADPNTIPNKIYSAEELVVGAPTVAPFDPVTVKSGDRMFISGSHLDMIKSVTLPRAGEIEFDLAEDGNTISFIVPSNASDGDVVLTSFAGTEFVAGGITTVTVADVNIVSLAEDGRFKAGAPVEITGEDLDLVTKVEFTNAEAFWYLEGDKIVSEVPASAQDGVVTLSLDSGKQAFSQEIEVVKPEIFAWESVESVVAGKGSLAIEGLDLDLVTSAKIGTKEEGFVECPFHFEEDEVGDIFVVVDFPREAYTAPVILSSAAGYESETYPIYVIYDEAISVVFSEKSFGMGNPISITGANLLLVDQVYIKGKRVTSYGLRADDAMSFAMPDGIGPGVYRLQFVLQDGTELTWPVAFEVTAPFTEKFIWEGYEDLGEWSNQPYLGAEGAFADAGIVEGDIVRVYFTPLADDWMFQAYAGHWDILKLDELGGGSDVSSSTCDPSNGYFAFTVTPQVLQQLTAVEGWGGSWTCNGQHVAMTGLSLVHFGASEKRTTIWEGSVTVGNWDGSMSTLSWGGYDWSTVQAGTKLAVTFTADADDAVMRFGNGSWASMPSLAGLAPDGNIPIAGLTSYEFELTDADIDQLVNAGGLVICGAYWTITEVALVTMEGGGPIETVVWEGSEELAGWVNQPYLGAEGVMTELGLEVGSHVRIYFTTFLDEWIFQIYGGHWEGMSFAEVGGSNEVKFDNYDASAGYFEFEVTADQYAVMTGIQGWGGTVVVQGDGVTVTKMSFY